MEIIDCKPEDSGEYKCVATNKHGTDETNCVVIVESEEESKEQQELAHNFLYSGGKKNFIRSNPLDLNGSSGLKHMTWLQAHSISQGLGFPCRWDQFNFKKPLLTDENL
jgi:Immunoglobulin I-set domain.